MLGSVGLYFHIPFCAGKCPYCDFYSVDAADGLMDDYAKALDRHLREASAYLSNVVDTVYIGGGTPSLWGARRIDALLKRTRKLFSLSPKAEITLEVNPDSAQPKDLERWRKSGVNRLSFGVQSTDDALLRQLGRGHNAQQAARAVAQAAEAGYDNLSVDLLYGLPGQTMEQWRQTLQTAAAWPVAHISCYALKVEKNTPLHKTWGSIPCIDDDLVADQYLLAVETLERLGFAQYEISNFAKPSRQSRHNLKYWTLEPFLGFGPSAHSDFGGLRYAYTRDLSAYIDGVAGGDPIVTESERIERHDRAVEYIMLGLRTTHGISEAEYIQKFQASLDRPLALLAKWERYGLTRQENGRWKLTPKGFLVSNRLIGELLGEHAKR